MNAIALQIAHTLKTARLVLLFGMLVAFACAQPMALAGSGASLSKPISITISKSLYLPEDMYGQWSITGTLVETNSPDFFNPTVHDIWILERVGDEVIISNPVNGASASIRVDKADGNTATFHRMVVSKQNKVFFEMPTITVNGDHLTGTTVNQFRYLHNGRVERSYYAQYKLEASRISGPTVRFDKGDSTGQPNIEIDDSQLKH